MTKYHGAKKILLGLKKSTSVLALASAVTVGLVAGTSSASAQDVGKSSYKVVLNFADGNKFVTDYNDVTASYVAGLAKDLADSYVAEKGERSPVFIDGNTYYYNFAGLTKEDPKADDKEKPSTDSDKKADKDTSKASDKKSAKDGQKEAASKQADKASQSDKKSQDKKPASDASKKAEEETLPSTGDTAGLTLAALGLAIVSFVGLAYRKFK